MRTFLMGFLVLGFAPAFLIAAETEQDDYVARMEREHATDEPVAS